MNSAAKEVTESEEAVINPRPKIISMIPGGLIALRTVLGPLLVWLSATHRPAMLIGAVLVAAMLSDIFDGVIARKLKIVTASLRVADSRADAWFFICVGTSVWLATPDLVRTYALPLSVEIGLQILSYSYDLIRYHRIASLHAYSAKIWAFSLFCTTIGILCFHFGALIWVTMGFGLVSFLDALAIKLILPGWRHDVLSSIHAARQRRAELKASANPEG